MTNHGSVSDLVSIASIDMEEFSSMVQKGKKKTKNDIEQLHDLDHQQTKALSKAGEDLELLHQYINEMTRTFASDYSITTFDALTALQLPSLPSILQEVYPVPVETEETSLWTKIKDGAVKVGKGVYNTGKGAVLGGADVVKDTAVGIGNTIIHPFETMDSMANIVLHPVDTGQYIGNAIRESYERDMVNGDAESRSHWVTYALGTAVTTVFGTKGAGTVTKTDVATTKAAATAGNTVKNMDFSQYLPYGPQYQLAGGGKVPYNVVDGEFLKDQLILKAERLDGSKGSSKNIFSSNTLNEKQSEIIRSVENGKIILNTTKQKGNYGEMKMDDYFESKDYTRISTDRVTDLDDKIIKGIDGVYENSNPPPKYVIGEAKYGSSRLGKTKSGKQMSDQWVDGNKRLEKSVGKNLADKIILEEMLNAKNVEKVLIRTTIDGNVKKFTVDDNGRIIK
ncbi:T7SS effector LXG polymorphic toxin [Lentibacillus sp. Marseille-P4043]|uniref:T7SS effector LXG polymorphic toxin n=1 Tax=Lentibacillus sp. Marseille-P4043 TaxID=2040293 RepID=UPI000D0B321C|nr:T7SS effector LXG polymorphic toxin [Lentibacillus sp. Marseille-P4043]